MKLKIYHRMSIAKGDVSKLRSSGISWSPGELDAKEWSPTVIWKLAEDDSRWPLLAPLIRPLRILDLVDTEFSKFELENAAACSFRSKSFGGFPEPSGAFEYREITYDSSDWCFNCGTGLKQRAPFRLAKPRTWARGKTHQLHWVFDELFVEHETWRKVFEPFGIGAWPVLTRRGVEMPETVQLRIDARAELIMPRDLRTETCPICRITKYEWPTRGFWPAPKTIPAPIFKSSQYLGDGAAADRLMYVSHDLYCAMTAANLNCRYWASAAVPVGQQQLIPGVTVRP